MKKKAKLKLSVFEIVLYALCFLVFLWGITYIVLGLIARFAPIPSSENEILKASDAYAKTFKMGFFGYGLIHTAVAWLVAIIVLLIYSKKSDREYEKEQRRAALRASARKSMGLDEDVIDAEVSEEPIEEEPEPVSEPEPVEEPAPEEAPAEEPTEEEK